MRLRRCTHLARHIWRYTEPMWGDDSYMPAQDGRPGTRPRVAIRLMLLVEEVWVYDEDGVLLGRLVTRTGVPGTAATALVDAALQVNIIPTPRQPLEGL